MKLGWGDERNVATVVVATGGARVLPVTTVPISASVLVSTMSCPYYPMYRLWAFFTFVCLTIAYCSVVSMR